MCVFLQLFVQLLSQSVCYLVTMEIAVKAMCVIKCVSRSKFEVNKVCYKLKFSWKEYEYVYLQH
jgi:hypothetical protein